MNRLTKFGITSFVYLSCRSRYQGLNAMLDSSLVSSLDYPIIREPSWAMHCRFSGRIPGCLLVITPFEDSFGTHSRFWLPGSAWLILLHSRWYSAATLWFSRCSSCRHWIAVVILRRGSFLGGPSPPPPKWQKLTWRGGAGGWGSDQVVVNDHIWYKTLFLHCMVKIF